jgi:transcriptional regulator with XRE-family HTH domain
MILEPFEEMLKRDGYWTTNIQLDLFREIDKYLTENKMSRKDFAKKLGVSKAYVSQVLNGEFDHKLSKLVKLSLAIEKVPRVSFVDLEDEIMMAKGGTTLPELPYQHTVSNENVEPEEALQLDLIPEYA